MSTARTVPTAVSALAWALVALGVGGGVASAQSAPAPGAPAAVTVTVTLDGVLVPGHPAPTAEVALGNPGSVPLTVVSLTADSPQTTPGCAPGVLVPSGELLDAPVVVPAGRTTTVPAPGPGLAPDAPAACMGADVVLTYTAHAHAG